MTKKSTVPHPVFSFLKNWNFTTTAITLIPICIIAFLIVGCEPTTESIINPQKKVTLEELAAEVEMFIALANARAGELQKKIELRNAVINHLAIIARDGTIQPLSILPSLLGILGIGATVDNVRMRKKFTLQKSNKNSG